MAGGLWRKIKADLRTNRFQFLLIGGVLTMAVMLLTLSLLVLESASEPWDRTFAATNGPHLWLVSHQHDLDFSPVTRDTAVTGTTGTILSLAENPLILGDEEVSLFLYAMDELPPVAHPLLAGGRWISPGNPDEVVLDYSLAKYYDFQVGDLVDILGTTGVQPLEVVGLAVTAHWFPYDDITRDVSPGVAYISQRTLESLQPDPESWYSVMGLRIKEPETSKEMVDQVNELFAGKLRSVIEWQYVKENATLASTLNGMFMGLFSILGVIAVGLIIFNVIGGQVLSQYREIGLLKAVGFRPGQVTLLFLIEQLTIGLFASLLGVLLALVVAPGIVNQMADNLNTVPPEILSPAKLLGVILLVEAAVALATWLPAWQGGRIDTVQAITVGYRSRNVRRSRLGQFTRWLKLPPVILLGVKDVFSRPLRTVLAVLSLLLTVMVAMTAIGAQTTIEYLARDRFYFNGTTADLKVTRNFVPHDVILDEIHSMPEVLDYYQELPVYGLAPGHSEQPVLVRLLGGNYPNFNFPLKAGRMISAPGEAVMGYAVYEMLGVEIGDRVEIQLDEEILTLKLVGRHAENLNLNKVIITSLDSYQPGESADIQPNTYYLRLDDPAQAETLRRELLDQYQGAINVKIIEEEPVASVVQLTSLITSMAVILMLVAVVNLISTSLLSVRERVRDFGIQKTIGLTPAQVATGVIVGAVTIVLFALLLGVTLGMVIMENFIQQVGIAIGAGPDFYLIQWGWISLLLPILLVLAVLSSLLPAVRAAQLEVTDALRYE